MNKQKQRYFQKTFKIKSIDHLIECGLLILLNTSVNMGEIFKSIYLIPLKFFNTYFSIKVATFCLQRIKV